MVMPTSEIRELTNHFVEQLLPVRIYLFGSFADSTYTEESDFDFYIIVQDAVSDILAETTKAYKSIRKVKQRPVDIVVGTVSRFEARKEIPSIENDLLFSLIKSKAAVNFSPKERCAYSAILGFCASMFLSVW